MRKWFLLPLLAWIGYLAAEEFRGRELPFRRPFRQKTVWSLPKARPAGSCRALDGLPDPVCTPGAVDPSVTGENIRMTICARGYTRRVRPPASYTNPLKVQQIREYGFGDTRVADYEEDHLIPLELGGHPTDPHNLWPEPGRSPNPKDSVEGQLRRLVCEGRMSLVEAQTRIRVNWKTAVR